MQPEFEMLTHSAARAVASFVVRDTAVRCNVVAALVLLVDDGLGWLRRWGWLGWWRRRVVGSSEGSSSKEDGKGEELGEVHVFCLVHKE